MNQRLIWAAAAVAVGSLFLVLLVIIVAVTDDEAADDCGVSNLARSITGADAVEVAGVPAGPIAGYGHEQLVNAAQIMAAASAMGLSQRDQQIGVMTAMGESELRVLDYGDSAGPDSRGLFQQRANGAWGSLADRMDPFTSATSFFKVLAGISDRDKTEPTIVAHQVQRNADPFHYEPWWDPAVKVVAALSGTTTKTSNNPVTQPNSPAGGKDYALGAVQPQLEALVSVLAPMFDIQTVGGYRASATDPNGHPSGLAADFMTSSRKQGEALAEYAKSHAGELGIEYIIWRQRIWSTARSAEGWRPMEDRGSPTANHMDHVHINVLADADAATISQVTATAPAPGTAQTSTGCASNVALTGGWVAPIEGAEITSDYGPRVHPISGEASFHDGADYGAGCGTPFRAAFNGVVTAAGADSIYGHLIEIDHGQIDGKPVKTRYGHMYADGLAVKVGDQVVAGEVIGRVGNDGNSTGCHLHFIVEVAGKTTNPVPWLASHKGSGVVDVNGGVTVPIRGQLGVAVANIPDRSGAAGLRSSMPKVLSTRPDFVALNEQQGRSLAQIQSVAPGYTAWRDPTKGKDPGANQTLDTVVMWSKEWTRLDSGRVKIVEDDHASYQGRSVVWDRFATWALLQRGDGAIASIVSVHHMTNPAKFGPNKPSRQQLYGQGMDVLLDLVTTLSAHGPVFVGGDFNTHASQASSPWSAAGKMQAAGYAWFDHGVDFVFHPRDPKIKVVGHWTGPMASDHHWVASRFALQGATAA